MHRLHRLHNVHSIITPSINRPFALSACVLHPSSNDPSARDRLSSFSSFLSEIVQPAHKRGSLAKRLKRENQKSRKKKTDYKVNPKHSSRDTIESSRVSIAELDAKRIGVLQKLLDHPNDTVREQNWSTGWGKDVLQPTQNESLESTGHHYIDWSTRRGPPPHISRHPLSYTRRVEGLLDDVQHTNVPSSKKPSVLQDVDPLCEHKPIARLAHGLDRVLFNPGVFWLQDPRSRVYNFTPWLETIPKVTDFAFERITGFIRSSQDNDLHNLAKLHSRPYVGSTSSLTGLLSHIYFLISNGMDVDTSVLSHTFAHEPKNFTPGQRMPVSVVLRYEDGVWAVDSGKDGEDESEKNVLTWMGTLLEKFLTVPESEFKTLLRSSPAPSEDGDNRREAYRYAKSDRFLMRSQLDCVDPRLPGTGVFDVKTRAAVPIRLDLLNFEENSGYLIRTLHGSLESFEKEYYDLIRSAFLKYSFQARIGNMDGVFVAYHNTARVFGFQYISLEEMDARLFGPGAKDSEPAVDGAGPGAKNSEPAADGAGASTRGARIFEKCVRLLERVMDEIVTVFGERSVRCTVETRDDSSKMNVWVEPLDWDAKEDAKGSDVVELKEDVETTQGDGEGAETNGAKEVEVERPIVQIEVEVQNFIAGEPVRASRAIRVAPHEDWMLHWAISRSSLETSKIRANLASARERQFRAWNFPANISGPEEMEAWWNALDFGGRRSAALPSTASDVAAADEISDAEAGKAAHVVTDGEDTSVEEGPKVNGDRHQPPTFNPLLFRPPSTSIELLRRLSREGREETLRAEAEEVAIGREKVIWGVAEDDHLSGMAPGNEPSEQLAENISSVPAASKAGTADVVEKKGE